LVSNLATQCVFLAKFFAKFRSKFFLISTYTQRIFHGKNDPNLPDFKEKINPHRQIFKDKFQQQVAKNNIEGF
jgi:hypothetical protein